MEARSSSVRIRESLRNDLRLAAAELSEQREMTISTVSLLEEGIEGLFQTTLDQWIAWAREGEEPVSANATSISFRIRSDLSRKLSVLAAQITKHSGVPVTKVHLTEEAGRRLLAQLREERAELEDADDLQLQHGRSRL